MEDLRSLKALQLDALREVANIGAGHAATALSQMIGETIMISVPRINVARLEDVPPQVAASEQARRLRNGLITVAVLAILVIGLLLAVPGLRGVVDVPNCAHWTQQERPDLVTAALLDFLRGL